MIGTLKRRASRIGLITCKILVSIEVIELLLPNDECIQDHAMLSICFERGGKISSTTNKIFNRESLNLSHNPMQKKVILKSVVVSVNK